MSRNKNNQKQNAYSSNSASSTPNYVRYINVNKLILLLQYWYTLFLPVHNTNLLCIVVNTVQ